MRTSDCGCLAPVDPDSDMNGDDCFLPEALRHLEAMLKTASWSNDKVHKDAEAFLSKVKGATA